ncbi:hypothetical protein HMPREF9446_02871 [Bacteroides fluxus YIT 12057]|uniref:Uncharacterized protein n=1 Tax=Bacteroides fluxus YIT 12057 TaxID=763034 RepID=F3PVU3_9BACE|nr:hypothetical protein HMPREF9446_02871 [Bacteroides fluxus YIT 12057]
MLFRKLRGRIDIYYENNMLPLSPIYIYYKTQKIKKINRNILCVD